MHRLFVAIRPAKALLEACLVAAHDAPAGWAAQDVEQLHLTLRYIGEVERPMAEDIADVLGTLRSPRVEVGVQGVGFFDQGLRGALFARTVPRDPLAALHKKVDRLLVGVGLPPEGRTYLPHITLARRRRSSVAPGEWLERYSGLTVSPEPVSHVVLYESDLTRDGARYEPTARFELG